MIDWILYPIFKLCFYYTFIGAIFAVAYCQFNKPQKILTEIYPVPVVMYKMVVHAVPEGILNGVAFAATTFGWWYVMYRESGELLAWLEKASKASR